VLKVNKFIGHKFIFHHFLKMAARLFVVSAFLFGSIFIFVVPPFQVADEFNHFYRAWQVSEGILVGVRTSDNRLGGDLPESVVKITEPFRSLPFHAENRIKSSTIFYNLSVPLEPEKRQFTDFTNTAVYAPTAYLPQAVAIIIGKFFRGGPLSIFYFSRLLTLIFWLSMVYAALKILPFKNDLFATLALLPSSLFINASASGDVVTNACSFLVIAVFMTLIVDKKSENKRPNLTFFSLIFILTILISLNKPAYFPIAFLIFLVPKEQFNGLKNKLLTATALVLTNVLTLILWTKTIQPLYIKYEDYHPIFRVGQQLNEKVDPSVQIAFLLHNPLIFSKIATFSLLKTFPSTLVHYVGKFGWEKNYLPIPIIVLFILLILIQAVFSANVVNVRETLKVSRTSAKITSVQTLNFKLQTKKGPLSINAKFGLFGVGLLMTFGLATAMYTIWCPVGSDFIDNLGGKYFIPIYPLFFLAMPTFDTSNNRILNFLAQPKILYGALFLSLMWSIFQVISRYYA
jgi:uncharacterized membrane protein